MRIIAGKYKSRVISVPNSKLIRPTTDRVRETIFNILQNFISFENIKVLDVYAGSGSFGLECLSRGAKSIDFVEKNYQIFGTLKKNISSLKEENSCKIFKMEALKFSLLKEHDSYDLIFADPPFYKHDIYQVVNNLLNNNFLNNNSFMLVERSIQTEDSDVKNFGIESFKRIGDTCLYKFVKAK